jgi:hypothetical protein
MNVAGIIADEGEFFFAPAIGLMAFLLFVVGLLTAWLQHRRRRRLAGMLMLLNFAGAILSMILSCAGMPKR